MAVEISPSVEILSDEYLTSLREIATEHGFVDRIKTVVEQGAGIVKAMLGFSRGSDELPALCLRQGL